MRSLLPFSLDNIEGKDFPFAQVVLLSEVLELWQQKYPRVFAARLMQ